ncbi:MAG: (2Fe-2S)-binding protein [Burkholderiaceae bacterium]|nr:(2Fe-2S)-binding protein [Burkholderiaceae bacterium]
MSPDSADEGRAARAGALRRVRGVARGRPIRLVVDGAFVEAFEGESLAIALAASGRLALRSSPNARTPRGMFCLMGVCQECVVEVDGALSASCSVGARDGMVVSTDTLWRARDVVGGAG